MRFIWSERLVYRSRAGRTEVHVVEASARGRVRRFLPANREIPDCYKNSYCTFPIACDINKQPVFGGIGEKYPISDPVTSFGYTAAAREHFLLQRELSA